MLKQPFVDLIRLEFPVSNKSGFTSPENALIQVIELYNASFLVFGYRRLYKSTMVSAYFPQ